MDILATTVNQELQQVVQVAADKVILETVLAHQAINLGNLVILAHTDLVIQED